jgi:hypothetical protein
MVRALERDGILIPTLNGVGVAHFTEADVERVARERMVNSDVMGALAARVFKAFADGKDLADIVIEMKLPPSTVRALYDEFVTPLDRAETPAAATTNPSANARTPHGRP